MWLGIIVPVLLMGFEYYMSPFKEFKTTQLGITQQKMKLGKGDKTSLIDEDRGTLALSGWDVNTESSILVNHYHAAPLSLTVPAINKIKYRTWNYFLLHTEKHII